VPELIDLVGRHHLSPQERARVTSLVMTAYGAARGGRAIDGARVLSEATESLRISGSVATVCRRLADRFITFERVP
jgi:hypothetical protein